MLTKIVSWLKRARSEKGFTLIELVVVIGIMGVLAGIAVPRYASYREKAQQNADLLTARVVQTAIELYNAIEGSYPSGGFTGAAPADAAVTDLFSALKGKGALEDDPKFSSSASLTYDASSGKFTVTHSATSGGASGDGGES